MILNQYFILVVRALGVVLGFMPWVLLLWLWIMGTDDSSIVSVDIGLGELVTLLVWSSPGLAIFTLSLYLERLRKSRDPFDTPPGVDLR